MEHGQQPVASNPLSRCLQLERGLQSVSVGKWGVVYLFFRRRVGVGVIMRALQWRLLSHGDFLRITQRQAVGQHEMARDVHYTIRQLGFECI